MSTTIHLPPELLQRIEMRAGELGISRNRFIRRALEKAIEEDTSWSPHFLKTLAQAAEDTESHRAVDEMLRAIAARRSRKRAPRL